MTKSKAAAPAKTKTASGKKAMPPPSSTKKALPKAGAKGRKPSVMAATGNG
jgi:hypothetical protein